MLKWSVHFSAEDVLTQALRLFFSAANVVSVEPCDDAVRCRPSRAPRTAGHARNRAADRTVARTARRDSEPRRLLPLRYVYTQRTSGQLPRPRGK